VGSTAGVISGLSPGTEKAGEDLQTTYVPNGTTDIIIITVNLSWLHIQLNVLYHLTIRLAQLMPSPITCIMLYTFFTMPTGDKQALVNIVCDK
jgi:hypothetical protein